MNVEQTVRYSDLHMDMNLYPRGEVDIERVENLRNVLETGTALPPIIIDQRNRIVDGFHRARAHQWAGPEFGSAIPCEVHTYKDDAEFFLDAIRRNADHGLPLSKTDQQHCLSLAERHGVSVAQLATVLSVRVERVTGLAQTKSATVGLRPRAAMRRANESNGGGGYMREHDRAFAAPMGLAAINALLVALRGGDRKLDLNDREIRKSLETLSETIQERLGAVAV